MDPAQAADVKARLDAVVDAVDEIRQSISKLADAYTRLAVLEERQASGKEALERAWREIDSQGARIRVLEAAAPVNAQTTTWVNKVIGLVIAAVVGGAIATGLNRHAPRAEAPVQIESGR
jgi:hypothetical protein